MPWRKLWLLFTVIWIVVSGLNAGASNFEMIRIQSAQQRFRHRNHLLLGACGKEKNHFAWNLLV